jgi:class 3 adenylate cyclase
MSIARNHAPTDQRRDHERCRPEDPGDERPLAATFGLHPYRLPHCSHPAEVNTTGDGLLAAFEGPARGMRCARAITDAVRLLGVEVRAGLHTGECEVRDDLGGLAVHIATRVGSLAKPGEVLVSSTVKDLVAGSGIAFAERGAHVLKGVPDEWRLYAVTS